jgi:hypothetical protein
VGNNNNNNIFEKETKGDGGVGHQNRKKLDLLLGWFYFILFLPPCVTVMGPWQQQRWRSMRCAVSGRCQR